MSKPRTSVILRRAAYDELRKLTEWYEAMPDWLDPSDHMSEQVWERQSDIAERAAPRGWLVVSVQIETEEYAQVHNTQAGMLVALVEREQGSATTETCVVLIRGAK